MVNSVATVFCGGSPSRLEPGQTEPKLVNLNRVTRGSREISFFFEQQEPGDKLGRIQIGQNASNTDIHLSTYPKFFPFIRKQKKNPKFLVRSRYVSKAYPRRIRIRYVSDTRYGKYPRIIDGSHENAWANTLSDPSY